MDKKALVINQLIVDSFLLGDKSAFSIIYEKLKGEIYSFAYKIVRSGPDAEDITATVFEKLWMYRPKLESPTHLKNWLFVTARNKCLNTLRDNQVTYPLTEEMTSSSDPGMDASSLEREQIRASVIETLWQTVCKLPPVRRKVMQLRFHENLTVDEIAVFLGLSPQTVRNHLSRGKSQMQGLLMKVLFSENDLFLLLLILGLLKLHEALH
jgi:RNA polymerase sigma-70 factor (family 1)